MATLDLYSKRQPHIVKLESYTSKGESMDYKIPTEYTLEETELLLQHQINVDKISQRKAKAGKETDDLLDFFEAVLVQMQVLFQRYHPDMTLENLKSILTKEEAIAMWAFFVRERLDIADGVNDVKKVKKKVIKKN